MNLPAHHPFRSTRTKERFLRRYDLRAREWPVPSDTRMVDTAYGPTFVRISGPASAPPLVLLHGISGSSLQWLPNAVALSAAHRLYAVDTISDCGRSVHTHIPTGADDFTGWLDELFDALNLNGDVNLMGLSYGGWLACRYALRYPARLGKIVLCAPAGTVLPLSAGWIARAVLCAVPLRYFTRSFMYWLLADLARDGESGRQSLEEWVEDAYLAARCFKPRRLVNPAVLTDEELQAITVPALFLVGENERIYSAPRAIERLNRVAPHIHARVIPRAGHDLTIVQAELVNRVALEFLDQG